MLHAAASIHVNNGPQAAGGVAQGRGITLGVVASSTARRVRILHGSPDSSGSCAAGAAAVGAPPLRMAALQNLFIGHVDEMQMHLPCILQSMQNGSGKIGSDSGKARQRGACSMRRVHHVVNTPSMTCCLDPPRLSPCRFILAHASAQDATSIADEAVPARLRSCPEAGCLAA